MMRTIVIRVDVRASSLQHRLDAAVHLFDDGFGEQPARDARLVGYQDESQPGVIQGADRVDRPRIERQALDAIEKAPLFDEGTVPIDKHSRCWR